jgi:hypothetical protein
MSGEQSWVAKGVDCICVRESWFHPLFGTLDGPKFMQQYTITDIAWRSHEDDGHRIKIEVSAYPDDFWCACSFRPLEKLKDTETELTAPVVPEKTPEKVS